MTKVIGRKVSMNAMIKQAVDHWHYVAPLGDLVSDYENEHLPMPKGDGRAALAFLMEQHGLGQSDLAEVATQSVISEILRGKRQLNIRHIKALSERFNVSADTFF